METRAPFVLIGAFVLAVVLGVFGFVYWLNNAGAIGRRATYQVAFEGPVPGLLTGAAVLFNGIRVGEVTSLKLQASQPRAVAATVSVAFDTPVRKDTRVGLDFQGLTGVPVVALEGGTSPDALAADAVLIADAGAGQSMTQAARDALRRVDAVLSSNAGPLQDTIGNLKTFSEALARNTPRLDNIMAGLDRSMGGAQTPQTKVTYDLEPVAFEQARAPMKAQIAIAEPTAVARLQTQQFLLPAGTEQAGFGSAQWSDSLPALIHARLLQSFENYDIDHPALRADVAAQGSTRMLLDLRKFEIDPAALTATMIVSAKILDDNSAVLCARIFTASEPMSALDAPSAAKAFNSDFQKLTRDLVSWTAAAL